MSLDILEYAGRGDVVVDGWSVPLLSACWVDDGAVLNITVDERFGISVSAAIAEEAAYILAQAIAVALGLSHHPTEEEAEPLEKVDGWQRSQILDEIAKIHPGLRPRRKIGLGEVKTVPLGPRAV